MYCSECGKKNKEGAKVCENCGYSLGFNFKEFVGDIWNKIKTSFKSLKDKEKGEKTYFSKRKYLSYAAYFQVIVWITYFLYFAGGLAVGIIVSYAADFNLIQAILMIIACLLVAFVLAWLATLLLKIIIQNMRWKVDIHNAVLNNKESK